MTTTAVLDDRWLDDVAVEERSAERAFVAAGDEHDTRPETLCVGEAR